MPSGYLIRRLLVVKNFDILRTHGFAPAGDSEEARTPYWVTRVSMSFIVFELDLVTRFVFLS